MIFGVFVLFAQKTAQDEPKNEVNEEVKAEAPAEAQPEAAQPAEANEEAAVKEEPAEADKAEAATDTKPAETAPEAQQEEAQVAETTAAEPESSEPEEGWEAESRKVASGDSEIEYYRPYLGVGAPMIVIGSLSVLVFMPAMGAMAFAASDGCKGKDWEFCKQCGNDHHAAWTTGAVLTGVLGAGMVIVGSWLSSIERPKSELVEVSGISILPSKDGMFASVGLKF